MLQAKTELIHQLPFDTFWMDILRGLAAPAIIIHHWLLFLPHQSDISLFYSLAQFICSIAGTAVHIFFIISGCGLALSYYKKTPLSWPQWAIRRIKNIILPYWIVITLTFFLVNLFAFLYPRLNLNTYSWPTLITYLTFTRNFYQPSWTLNPALWFMPVIFGLYLIFPLLIYLLKKTGPLYFLIISLLITYGSIALCMFFGYDVDHQTALFPFFLIEFSLGMALGYILYFHPLWFNRLASFKMLCLGLCCYIASPSWPISCPGAPPIMILSPPWAYF